VQQNTASTGIRIRRGKWVDWFAIPLVSRRRQMPHWPVSSN
jgi:hypothetical protein